jgi:hypothetical protein
MATKPVPDPRVTQALLKLTDAVGEAEAANLPATLAQIADATRGFKRLAKRGAPLPEEFERVEFVQARGPTVEFTGRRLAETNWETNGARPLRIVQEVWETQGGALVAVSTSAPVDGDGFEDARVLVVEATDDVQAMRFAVMGHFDWNDRARSMAKKLGWSLRVEVE